MATKPTTAPASQPVSTTAQPVAHYTNPACVLVIANPLPTTYKAPKAGSARAKWLAAIMQAASKGQTVAQFCASVAASPPSLQPNGKYGKAGTVEPPRGWLAHFAKAGVLQVTLPKA